MSKIGRSTLTKSSPFETDTLMFTVTDMRQYLYCPRIVYYTYCLPLLRPTTFKMQEGVVVHREEKRREQRRSLRIYGLPEGERYFDLSLISETLGLSGKMDLAIRIDKPALEMIPVEYKHSRKAGTHVKRQLAAYALLLQEIWELPVRRAFVYFIPTRQVQEMSMTAALMTKVRRQIVEMREMVRTESMPLATSRRAKCVACEFRRFCNDM